MAEPVPNWLCRNCDDLANKFTSYVTEPVLSVEEVGWIESDLRKSMLPQTLLTDLGHVYSLKLKHRQPISVPHRVTYFTLLTTTLFFRALKSYFRVSGLRSSTSSIANSTSSFLHHNKQGHQLALLNQHILLSKRGCCAEETAGCAAFPVGRFFSLPMGVPAGGPAACSKQH